MRRSYGKMEATKVLDAEKRKLPSGLVLAVGIAVAVGVQVLSILPVGSTIVRVAIGDFIIPFALLLVAYAYFVAGRRRPNWVVPQIDYALLGFLCLLGVASLIGLYRTDTFIAWAWGPKFIGFGLLLAYFLVGVLVAEAGEHVQKKVVLSYIWTSWIIAALALFRFFVELNGLLLFGYLEFRPIGFSNNPNAFAFLLGTALLLQIFAFPRSSTKLRLASAVGLAIISATLFLIASRSVYLGLIFTAPAIIYFWRRLDWPVILCAASLVPFIVVATTSNYDLFVDMLVTDSAIAHQRAIIAEIPLSYATRDSIVVDGGVASRWETMLMAFGIWRETPIFGVGLGGFMHYYAQIHDGANFALHTSGIWLLTETGLVGLFYFLAIYIAFTLKNFKCANSNDSNLHTAVFCILLFSMGASIGTEIIYQRQLWLLVGLTAAHQGAWRISVASQSSKSA
ncbi:MAG: O-antigen ligase family protein [Roseicyclus sp.]|uniref:O-antigen ligase family protein n=1 Tax=Roseicyclus sp. TaxID=1914329 RepID=UPI003A84A362